MARAGRGSDIGVCRGSRRRNIVEAPIGGGRFDSSKKSILWLNILAGLVIGKAGQQQIQHEMEDFRTLRWLRGPRAAGHARGGRRESKI